MEKQVKIAGNAYHWNDFLWTGVRGVILLTSLNTSKIHPILMQEKKVDQNKFSSYCDQTGHHKKYHIAKKILEFYQN